MAVTYDRTTLGYVAFNGPQKIAEIEMRHFKGLQRDSVMVFEPLPKEQWQIRLVSTQMNIDLLKEVLAGAPTDPN